MDGCGTNTDGGEEANAEAMAYPTSAGSSAASDASTVIASVSNSKGPTFEKALVEMLSILTPLRNELDDLSAFLAHYRRDNPTPLPPKLASLPGRLKYASTQVRQSQLFICYSHLSTPSKAFPWCCC